MDILNQEIKYQNQVEFESLIKAIQENIITGKLEKYADHAWSKTIKESWNGEYISHSERKIFRLKVNNHISTHGQPNFDGAWEIWRKEALRKESNIYTGRYEIRAYEPSIFADIEFEITYSKGEKYDLYIDWENEHPKLIISTIEFGIISAIEDCKPMKGNYSILVKKLRYHHIDTSFSLLEFAASRNFKRALFLEHLDFNHRIEGYNLIRKFRPTNTIGEFDLKHY